jgi:hypothetical protein
VAAFGVRLNRVGLDEAGDAKGVVPRAEVDKVIRTVAQLPPQPKIQAAEPLTLTRALRRSLVPRPTSSPADWDVSIMLVSKTLRTDPVQSNMSSQLRFQVEGLSGTRLPMAKGFSLAKVTLACR